MFQASYITCQQFGYLKFGLTSKGLPMFKREYLFAGRGDIDPTGNIQFIISGILIHESILRCVLIKPRDRLL